MPRSSASASSLSWRRFILLALLCLCFISLPTVSAQKNKALQNPPNDFELRDFYLHYDEPEVRNLQDSTTESTRVNFWGKLKESLGLTIVGCILIFCVPCIIWKNEGRHVRELVRIDFAKTEAVAVDCNTATDDTLGHLVHFAGPISVGDAFLDFGSDGDNRRQSLDLLEPIPKAFILKRTCFIYQKFEDAQSSVQHDRIGGGETRQTTYTLREDWTNTPQPQQLPHLPQHTNSRGIWDQLIAAAVNNQDDGSGPGMLPELPEGMAEKMGLVDTSKKPHGIVIAPNAAVGAFGLDRKIVLGNMTELGSDTKPVPVNNLPDTIEGCTGMLRGSDNVLRNFPEGDVPFNGAVKVVFEYVEDGFDASFVVQQTKEEPLDEEMVKFGVDRAVVVGKCKDDYGDIWMVRKGRHSLQEMVDMSKEDEGKVVKVIRIICWVGLFAGWIMLFSIFTTALSTLPLLGSLGNFAVVVVAFIFSCTCACTVLTAAYIRYRPLLACGLLAVAGGIWGILAWRMDEAAESGGETTTSAAATTMFMAPWHVVLLCLVLLLD